jgi:predicted nuclease with TOPRIM domain
MNQIIEVNIADVLLRLEGKIDHLTNEVNEVKINVAKLDEKVNSLDNRLETSLNDKFSGLDKRLANIEFVARSIAGGIIIALLLAFARYLFPNVTL